MSEVSSISKKDIGKAEEFNENKTRMFKTFMLF